MPRLSRDEKLQKNLQDLYYKTVEFLLEKIDNQEILASELSSIIKLLKDSGTLSGTPTEDETVSFPEIDLPFGDDEEED